MRYRRISVVMAASPLAAFALNSLIGRPGALLFFVESCGLWAFAYYWWVKNDELKKSSAIRKALRAA